MHRAPKRPCQSRPVAIGTGTEAGEEPEEKRCIVAQSRGEQPCISPIVKSPGDWRKCETHEDICSGVWTMRRTGVICVRGAALALASLLIVGCARLPGRSRGLHYPRIKDLSWMIGEWTDTQAGKTTTNVCRWSRNRNFISRTFNVSENGQAVIEGTEIIGWDPAAEQIRSWTFDSKGGFVGGVWRRDEGEWTKETIENVEPPDPSVRRESLSPLDWLVGTWVDDGGDVLVESKCKWAGEKAFLSIQFTVHSEKQPLQEGLTIVGWDDQKKCIRSWMFDTDGGIAEGTGVLSENTWQMRNRHILPDGRLASAITMYRKIDDNHLGWRRIAQEVDGELRPDMEEIVVVRQ